MGKTTNISWTNKTHNFWYGCKKVSQGCRSCYAEREMKRFGRDFNSVTRAKGFDKPLKWKDPAMVFVNSWSDFFIEEADEWRDEAWEIIRRTPHLTYQILTKRPERIRECLPKKFPTYELTNVWWGVSVENSEAEWRIEKLIGLPLGTSFLSLEPLLGPVRLMYYLDSGMIDWIIVGGESGPNYRPMDLEWARDILSLCRDYKVPFFMKQDAGPKPGLRGRIPDDLWIQEFPVVEP